MGILRGRIEDYSSPLAGVPARLYAGYFFLKYGMEKFNGGFGGASLHETLRSSVPRNLSQPLVRTRWPY